MDGKVCGLLISSCFIALVASAAVSAQHQSAAEIAKSGLQAFQSQNFVEAKTALSEAVRLDPGNAKYHTALAEVDWSLRDVQGAAHEFEIATKLDPTNAAVRSRLAQLYQSMDRDLDVIRVLRAPDPPEPLQSVWRFSRGFSLLRVGRLDAARREFLPLVNHPDFEAATNFFLGRIAFTQNRFEAALPYFEKALRAGDSPTIKEYSSYTYYYGLTLFKLGRYAEANEQFRLSTQRYALEPLAWMMRGRCDEELKDYQAAIDDYEQSIKVDPEFELSYYHLARLQQRYGDKQRADELFKHLGNLREADLREALARAEKQAMLKTKPDPAPSPPSNVPAP
jgi:tetratricopeptide (TPR) repeat protein